jgi:hypothetical protein
VIDSRSVKRILFAGTFAGAAMLLAQAPQAQIANSKVKAVLYLPDETKGYYQGTRFDWAGAIASLEAGGHSYFGKWFDRYDPKIHDAITGPVEEFLSGDSVPGYAEAAVGEKFVRIGVGALRKPQEPKFERFKTYEIVDYGKRGMKQGPDWIEFTHELGDTNGYAYVYTKRLVLTKDRPELVIEHTLRSTGKKTIDSDVYNHDFYMLDNQPTGPDFVVKFAFAPRANSDFNGLAEVQGNDLRYLKELQPKQTASTEFSGFLSKASDNDVRVENRKTGAGVRERGDLPLSKLIFWSIRTTVCPEGYVHLRVQPGKQTSWKIQYEFYSL